MAVRKPNITKIQVTPSMIKVPPSRIAASESWVSLIIKQEFPSETNRAVAKILKGETAMLRRG